MISAFSHPLETLTKSFNEGKSNQVSQFIIVTSHSKILTYRFAVRYKAMIENTAFNSV